MRSRRFALSAITFFTVMTTVVAACSPPQSSERRNQSESLTVTEADDGVYCDETPRPAATVTGARPGETIELDAPMPIPVSEIVADQTGTAVLLWRCDPSESRLTWKLTATGADSGAVGRFTVSGTDRDPILDKILIYEPIVDPVVCDDAPTVIGRLSNAEPSETIDLTSPDRSGVAPLVAGSDGSVVVRWACSPDRDGVVWQVTARGLTSKRVVEFELVGQAPQPTDPGGIEVHLIEDPFVCDRGRRPVARLHNLTPGAEITFNGSTTDDSLRAGTADTNGTLAVFWQCSRRDDGMTWELTATEVTPAQRSITFTFGSTTLESDVAIEIAEEPFTCDGTTRPFATLRRFVPREFIDFESPQSEAIRSGQADEEGRLTVRWSCTADQADVVWEVTATGRTSGATVAFTITGSPG